MRTIKCFDDLVAFVTSRPEPVYVRWTREDPKRDVRRGRSLNHQTGHYETGLSVERISPAPDDPAPRAYVVQQLLSYLALGGHPYLLTGEEVGTGSDGEPVLANPALVALLSPAVIAEARTLSWETGEVCRHDGRREVYTTGTYCCQCNSVIAR